MLRCTQEVVLAEIEYGSEVTATQQGVKNEVGKGDEKAGGGGSYREAAGMDDLQAPQLRLVCPTTAAATRPGQEHPRWEHKYPPRHASEAQQRIAQRGPRLGQRQQPHQSLCHCAKMAQKS